MCQAPNTALPLGPTWVSPTWAMAITLPGCLCHMLAQWAFFISLNSTHTSSSFYSSEEQTLAKNKDNAANTINECQATLGLQLHGAAFFLKGDKPACAPHAKETLPLTSETDRWRRPAWGLSQTEAVLFRSLGVTAYTLLPGSLMSCTGRRISGKEVDQGLTLPQLLTCGLGQARECLLSEFTVASCEDCQEPGSAAVPANPYSLTCFSST